MKYTLIQTYPGYETLGITHCSENKTPEWLGTNFYDAHPKYWQKVEEVDYEILNYRDYNGNLFRYFNNGYAINSVKRLSDGEVFTIGDNIGLGLISKIIISWVGLEIQTESDGFRLKEVIKFPAKTPLFTTEDGVDIFEGDKFSVVQVDTFHKINECKHPLDYPHKWISFSTPEKAEEYILLNKPCLSINDLIYSKNAPKGYATNSIMESFKELVKSKL